MPEVTVAENIYIEEINTGKQKIIRWKKLFSDTQEILDRLGFGSISPKSQVKDLPIAHQQVVEICKALSKNCKILVLDEPTAAIDPLEETQIYNRFAEISKNKTAIIVTHRLGPVRLADRIVVIKNGEVVEIGGHAELLAAGGEYTRMYESQQQWYKDGGSAL